MDASLGGLSHTFRGEYHRLNTVGQHLERSVRASAQNYRETETGLARLLTPGGSQPGRGSSAQPTSTGDYIRGSAEGGR